MAISFYHPLLLLLLPLLFYPVYLWRRDSRQLPRFRRNLILGLRIALLTSLVLALAGLQFRFTVDRQSVVFVVDLSASCEKSRDAAETFIHNALKQKQLDDQAGIVVFGENARIDQSLTSSNILTRIESLIGRDHSNLSEGLKLADAMMPSNSRQRIVLLSDGRENDGEALQEVKSLAAKNIRVDVLPLINQEGPDVSIGSLEVPQKLFAGEKFPVKVRLKSNVAASVKLRLYRDQSLIKEENVQVRRGDNLLVYSSQLNQSGFFTFKAGIEAGKDTIAENNEACAFAQVEGIPRILLVEGSPGEARAIGSAIDSLGLQRETVSPDGLPRTLAGLKSYGTIIMCNVAAERLAPEVMENIHAAVRDLGIGFIMVGGEDSFGPGGYFKTPIEKALPVYMDLRGKKEIPSLGLILVIDKSGSMGGGSGGNGKIELAKEAAIQATEVLGPLDSIGVIAFDDAAQWVVKFQKLNDLAAIQDDIGTIRADGGTSIFPSLNLAYAALKDAKTKYKHIILLTDGQSATSGDYYFLARRMAKAGISMSTVAVGEGADQLLLQDLATWGQGRYYFSEDAYSIPRIFTKETMKAIKSYLVEESFYPLLGTHSSVLEGINQLPALDGYVATTPKKTASVVLSSPRRDPVLAHWQYGLGRSIAFTTDAGGRWSGSWVGWSDYNRFWGNMLSWTLPRAADNGLQLQSRLESNQGLISLESNEFSVSRLSQAVIVDPELHRQEIKLEAVAPGRYEGAFTARLPGVYFMNVSQKDAGGGMRTASGGLAISYSPEYHYAGTDYGYLQQLAKAGEGSILSEPKEAFIDNLHPVKAVYDLWPWLLIIAVLLLPLDIAARRLNILPADLKAGWIKLRGGFRAGTGPAETPATLARLQAKKSVLKNLEQESKNQPAAQNIAERGRAYQPGSRKNVEDLGMKAGQASDKASPQPEKSSQDKSSTAPPSGEERMSRLLEAKKRVKK
ncbi:MAG: VWA domain-containing protein [Syntrophomonas sp.]